jgi:hypothetical protein
MGPCASVKLPRLGAGATDLGYGADPGYARRCHGARHQLDGERLQGTTISRALDELVPEPPLFPADPERRSAVERAEAWGDEVLQSVPRRLAWAALSRDRSGVRSFLEGARLGMPTGLDARTSAPIIARAKRVYGVTDDVVRADLEALPGMLDRVDELIGEKSSVERPATPTTTRSPRASVCCSSSTTCGRRSKAGRLADRRLLASAGGGQRRPPRQFSCLLAQCDAP